MSDQEIRDALNAGREITFAGGTLWAKKSPTFPTVYIGCYSPEDCCQDDADSVDAFIESHRGSLGDFRIVT